MANERVYGNGTNSSIGKTQFNDFYYKKKALIEARKKQFFMQLSSTTNLPKNMGKTIKQYHYIPLLDDANINDQGIDANGAITKYKATFALQPPGLPDSAVAQNGENIIFITGEGTGAAAALTAAKTQAKLESAVQSAGETVVAWDTNWATTITAYIAAGWKVSDDSNNLVVKFPYEAPTFYGGNLWGSSKDIGTISSKLPALSESGGRVNRVGFTRVTLEASIEKFGFFDEYSKESVDFDSDADLQMHVNRTMIDGAHEITEAALQIDLLNGAGVVKYTGAATQNSEITAEGTASIPTYKDLMKLSIDLDNNRTPKETTIITGTRKVDTKTTPSARYMYIGTELVPMVKAMKDIDSTSKKGSGFISVEKYADAGTIANGEIGQVGDFKIIVVPEMLHWAGAGDDVSSNPGYRETNGKYDIFPMLVVGDQSFQTIGFQTNGQTVKFNIKHVKPESAQSYGKSDPYGEMGFMSIKWYYATMIMRPERIALVKCVGEW